MINMLTHIEQNHVMMNSDHEGVSVIDLHSTLLVMNLI